MTIAKLENDLPLLHKGKVRNTHQTNDSEALLLVATERVSTHNIIHNDEIPFKGEVLNMLTIFWLTEVLHELPNHLVATGSEIYDFLPKGSRDKYPGLHYRAVVVEKLDMRLVEFILRRYLTGSLWKAYQRGEDPYGLNLPYGLKHMHRFDKWVFTPTDKSETDEPLNSDLVARRHAGELDMIEYATNLVEQFLGKLGITTVDIKAEGGFSTKSNKFMLADELFTPDCCRFVMTADLKSEEAPKWLDKQLLRDEAERIWAGGEKYPLTFSSELNKRTSMIYLSLLEKITGYTLPEWRTLLD